MDSFSGGCPVRTLLKFINKLRFPTCSVCNEPVEIEAATVDEHGNAIHEECWLRKMRRQEQSQQPPKAS
jgi:hypothetical protein